MLKGDPGLVVEEVDSPGGQAEMDRVPLDARLRDQVFELRYALAKDD